MTTTKEALEPQAAFTIRWCPVCGRDDRINSFKAAHYSRGELCRGVPITIEYSRVPAPIAPVVDGISWTALLSVLERLKSKTRNPDAEWYHGWNAAIQCLVNDINARSAAPASPAALRDEADRVSAFAGSEQLSAQEDKPVKNYGDFRAGMLRAAEMARNEFKRAPEAAKGHDCVYMGGYEDACDHLSVVIAQAAVIDSVRIAGPQPDWQYHISLLLPEGIEDQALLKIFQVVEYELRAATTPPSTLARKAAVDEIIKGWFCHLPERDQERARIGIEQIIERCFAAGSEKYK